MTIAFLRAAGRREREEVEEESGAMNSKARVSSQSVKASPRPRRDKVSPFEANPRPFAVLLGRLALCLGKLAALLRTGAPSCSL